MKIFFYLIFFIFSLIPFHYIANGAEINGPEVSLKGNEIRVSAFLILDEKYIKEIRNGIEKEFRFYIDLFRVWNMWPDEFVLGKSITKTVKCDPVKSEFIATSFDGNILIERRFKSFESMMKWTLSIEDLKLTNIKELEPGIHFVRLTVESKLRNLPPVIGQFFIFLSENEFVVKKDSYNFRIGPVQ
ncbi:MAG: DUF4390 domain-containing protein [Nitrospirae bacterium]|nr:DUF4390 domain-containing protein [Nitrospirota bacterium]